MAIFLVVHTRYADVQFSIVKQYQMLEYSIISSKTENNKLISKNFIKIIENLLKESSLNFKDLDFIVAHTGPAPFTTLRSCLASINGLAFATHKPLIGVNGIEALINQYSHKENIIALLNAFANDVYYGIKKENSTFIEIGYDNVTQFLEKELSSAKDLREQMAAQLKETEAKIKDLEAKLSAASTVKRSWP